MNSFQKNVLFIGLVVVVIIAAAFGFKFASDAHNRALAAETAQESERKEEWKKDNIRQLKSLSGIGALSTEEQVRVDNAGDDLARLQQVLLDIHQERITFWSRKLEDTIERRRKLQTVASEVGYSYSSEIADASQTISKDFSEARENVVGYKKAMVYIRAWRPSDYARYKPTTAERVMTIEDVPASEPTQEIPVHTVSSPMPSPVSPESVSPSSSSYSADATIRDAVAKWRVALLSNNPDQQAEPYANFVERYFLATNWTNAQVKDYLTKLHSDGDFAALSLSNVAVDTQSESAAEVHFTKDFTIWRKGVTTTAIVRSVLHFVRENGEWKVNYERDFKS